MSLACWVIKHPSCPHRPSLPGWRSQPGSAFGSWREGGFSSRSIWLAGRLPRQLCWQLPLSLPCARAEDTPPALPPLQEPWPVRAWGLSTARGAPVLPEACSCRPQSAASHQWCFVCVLVTICQCLLMFSSEVPGSFVTSLIQAAGKCKVTYKTQGWILM